MNPGTLAPIADALPLHESNDCRQAIKLFRRNGSTRKKTKPNLRATHFQQIHFSIIFLTIFGSFSYLLE